jgi:hypothetical protein
VILRRGDGEREEIDLGGREPSLPEMPPAVTPVASLPDLGGLEETSPPGVSGLDEALRDLQALDGKEERHGD